MADCGLRRILVFRGRRISIPASMEPGPTGDGQENPRRFSTDRRKSKSRRPQFVVVISEECPDFSRTSVLSRGVALCFKLGDWHQISWSYGVTIGSPPFAQTTGV